VTIAMTFVVVLISGITLTITTCLKVWDRSRETADFNQEARAVIEALSRDIRGAYLGLHRRGGYFLAAAGREGQEATPTLEFTTESSSIVRAALLPEPARGQAGEQLGAPATDFVAVRYELLDEREADRPGLYRTTWVAPSANWLAEPPPLDEAVGIELISASVVALRLRYWNGDSWTDGWETSEDNLRLPEAVAVQLSLLDARGNEHVLESVILVPTH
jgi:hypothetical protein